MNAFLTAWKHAFKLSTHQKNKIEQKIICNISVFVANQQKFRHSEHNNRQKGEMKGKKRVKDTHSYLYIV